MQLLWSVCHVLLIASLSSSSEGEVIGCANWKLSGINNDICCTQCQPGNRLVNRCGKNRSELCTPCKPGQYITNPIDYYCKKCTQCKGVRFVQKNCTTSSDTVCGCIPGYHCGDSSCSFCVKECKKGQEPEERGCKECPPGTFSHKVDSKCTPWRESCPESQELILNGNATKDHDCRPIEYNTVEPPRVEGTKKVDAGDSFWPLVGFTGGVSLLVVVVIFTLWRAYNKKTRKNRSKTKTQGPLPETLPPEELKVEPDEVCSFRQPEQEQGGSLESISTQDSETKLIV